MRGFTRIPSIRPSFEFMSTSCRRNSHMICFSYLEIRHSINYWLWADLIAPETERLLKNVIQVHWQEEADLFYIPFFTTISFFLLEKQHCKALYREALKWVTGQPAWQRSEGRDHILPVHHPWSFKPVCRFMKKAIWLLPDMDSTGNWYKPGEVWLEKDHIFLMCRMLKSVMSSVYWKVNLRGTYCYSFEGGSKEMQYEFFQLHIINTFPVICGLKDFFTMFAKRFKA